MDRLHVALKWVDHNRKTVLYPVMAVVLCLVLFVVGCQAKTWSLKDPTVKVTEPQFEAEYAELIGQITVDFAEIQARAETLEKRADIGRDHLEEIKANRQAFVEGVIGLAHNAATGQPITPSQIAGGAIALLGITGIGYGAGKRGDTNRKDDQIAKRDEQIAKLQETISRLTGGKSVQT